MLEAYILITYFLLIKMTASAPPQPLTTTIILGSEFAKGTREHLRYLREAAAKEKVRWLEGAGLGLGRQLSGQNEG